MYLSTDPTSNVAMPMFLPGEDQTYVGFGARDRMYIESYIDDTVTPPKVLSTPTKYYRWYVCETNYSGYQYTTLAWVLGNAKPENPSCEKIIVVRVFA